ncbi:MAG: ankyrin repeat domain-containing protein [Simkaniaceae bacterium]|nr:ankyrin repeat domain-containing protein [Simkaniaceae bacterium]
MSMILAGAPVVFRHCLTRYCLTWFNTDSTPHATATDASLASKMQNFSIGYLRRHAFTGFVSGTAVGIAIGKVVALLPGTSAGGAIGRVATLLSGTSICTSIGKVVALLAGTSVGATVGRIVALLPGTLVGATVGGTCGTVVGLLLGSASGYVRDAGGKSRMGDVMPDPVVTPDRIVTPEPVATPDRIVTPEPETAPDPNIIDQGGFTELMRTVLKGNLEQARELVANPLVDLMIANVNEDGMTAFLYACREGNLEIAKLLRTSGRTEQSDVSRALVLAIEQGHTEIGRWLIASCDADVSRPDDSGTTPLMLASAKGRGEIIPVLVEHGAQVDEINREDNNVTALAYACGNGHKEIARMLLTEYQAKGTGKAFRRAVRNEQTEIVQWLIDEKIALSKADGGVAMKIACVSGYTAIVRLLSDKNVPMADINKGDKGRTPFLHACENGRTEIAQLLYENNRDVVGETTMRGKSTALMLAAGGNHTETVRWLVETCHINVHLKDGQGRGALAYATQRGHVRTVKQLLSYMAQPGTEINHAEKGGERWTPFMSAAYNGHMEIIRLFVSVDLTMEGLHQRSGNGWSPLTIATQKGRKEIVKFLLDVGSPVDGDPSEELTALNIAIANGDTDIVRLLVRRGADVNPPAPTCPPVPSWKDIPIILAARNGFTDIVRLLHAHGADLKRADYFGFTARERALEGNHEQTVLLIDELLITGPANRKKTEKLREGSRCLGLESVGEGLSDTSVDINSGDPITGETALMLAAAQEDDASEEVVRLLLAHPDIDITQSDRKGNTALMFAARSGRKDVVKLLLDAGDNALALRRNYVGRTALDDAISGGHAEVTELLLTKIRDIPNAPYGLNHTDTSGTTPLTRAAKGGDARSAELLIQHGADVDRSDSGKNTPMILAAARGDDTIIRALFAAKADPNLRNLARKTAPGMARSRGKVGTAKLIERLSSPRKQAQPTRKQVPVI